MSVVMRLYPVQFRCIIVATVVALVTEIVTVSFSIAVTLFPMLLMMNVNSLTPATIARVLASRVLVERTRNCWRWAIIRAMLLLHLHVLWWLWMAVRRVAVGLLPLWILLLLLAGIVATDLLESLAW